MKGSSYLIVGGKGYLGSLLAEHLIERGARVHCFDSQDGHDVANGSLLTCFSRNVDWIVNLVGPTIPLTEKCPRTANQLALIAATNCAQAARTNGTAFLQMSSVHVYGESVYPATEDTTVQPRTTYGRIKRDSEVVALRLAPYAAVVRLAAVYDERERSGLAPSEFGYRAVRQDPLIIHGNGQQSRPYLHRSDFLTGVVKLLEKGAAGGFFNLAGSKATTINDLAQAAQKAIGKSIEIENWPARRDDVSTQVISTIKLMDMGWRDEVPIEEGVERIVHAAQALRSDGEDYSDCLSPHRH